MYDFLFRKLRAVLNPPDPLYTYLLYLLYLRSCVFSFAFFLLLCLTVSVFRFARDKSAAQRPKDGIVDDVQRTVHGFEFTEKILSSNGTPLLKGWKGTGFAFLPR